MVIAHRLRLEAGGSYGDMSFSGASDKIDESYLMPTLDIGYRYYRDNRLGWWYGASASARFYSASDSSLEAAGNVFGLSALLGLRGQRWSAQAGLGLSVYDLSFLGKATDDGVSGVNIGQLTLGGEYAFGRTWSAFGSLDAGVNSEFSDIVFKAGLRYYIGNNVSIGLQVLAASLSAENDGSDQKIKASILSFGPTALLQF